MTCTALDLAQFFFGNFWHFLGMLFVLGLLVEGLKASLRGRVAA